jgi:hypothetical protein
MHSDSTSLTKEDLVMHSVFWYPLTASAFMAAFFVVLARTVFGRLRDQARVE